MNYSELYRSQRCLSQSQLPPTRWETIQVKMKQALMKSQAKNKKMIKSHMFMPYIEGLKMNWTLNDGLYHIFLKWRLNCKIILECELSMPYGEKKRQASDCLEWGFWD